MTVAISSLTASQRARRDRIVEAGLALLQERHYDQIQVKDVAERANVALGTLYRYFSSKEHLFAEVLASSLRTWVAQRVPISRVYDDLANAIALLLPD